MSSFLRFFGEILGHLYSLLTNSALAEILGVNLFWVLFGFCSMWLVLNTFVFRSSISPGSAFLFNSRSDSEDEHL